MLDKKAIKKRLGEFWEKYEARAVLVAGFLLVSIISFELGLLQGQKWQQSPLVIEKPVLAQDLGSEKPQGDASAAQKSPLEAERGTFDTGTPLSGLSAKTADCAFVGSKNSNKYHLQTCQWAKRIKPENMVCFRSVADASAKGYLPDKGCVK